MSATDTTLNDNTIYYAIEISMIIIRLTVSKIERWTFWAKISFEKCWFECTSGEIIKAWMRACMSHWMRNGSVDGRGRFEPLTQHHLPFGDHIIPARTSSNRIRIILFYSFFCFVWLVVPLRNYLVSCIGFCCFGFLFINTGLIRNHTYGTYFHKMLNKSTAQNYLWWNS